MNQEIMIGDKKCVIRQYGQGGPTIYWGTFLHREGEIERFEEAVKEIAKKKDFLLVAFFADDWNRDFSPWEAPAVFGNQNFGGKGSEMLWWLVDNCIPYIEKHYEVNEERYLIGYSLAGLFAIWSAYKSDAFTGIASCSGSLWFPGWDSYVKEHVIDPVCRVYLSLGTKEEKTKNKTMATVGNRTREQERILRETHDVILEWNNGGHFADSAQSLAKGIRWLLKVCI